MNKKKAASRKKQPLLHVTKINAIASEIDAKRNHGLIYIISTQSQQESCIKVDITKSNTRPHGSMAIIVLGIGITATDG